jgi:hypothetical protein
MQQSLTKNSARRWNATSKQVPARTARNEELQNATTLNIEMSPCKPTDHLPFNAQFIVLS